MSAVDLAVARLKLDEGFRAHIYSDTRGFSTIGYGANLDAGISQFAAAALLVAQAQERAQTLSGYWWAQGLDDARLSVVIEIAFNQGVSGLLHYVRMLSAIGGKKWDVAHDELLDSDAARLLPTRYKALAEILRTGVCNVGTTQAVG